MRLLRDARSQAEGLESFLVQREQEDRCLASLSPAYRQAAAAEERRRKIKKMVEEGLFRGRAAPEEVLLFYPTSYGRLREAVQT